MEQTYVHNPLLSTALHRRLNTMIDEFGYEPISDVEVSEDIYRELRGFLERLPSFHADGMRMLLPKLEKAEVLATETLHDGSNTFLVRVAFGHHFVDLMLSLHANQWRLIRPTSIHPRHIFRRKSVRRVGYVSFLLCAALAGAAVMPFIPLGQSYIAVVAEMRGSNGKAQPTSSPVPAANQQAGDHGVSPDATSRTQASSQGNSSNASASAATPKTYTFTLQPGMTVQDLANFLQQNGLTQDAQAFVNKLVADHLDTSMKAGVYTFTAPTSDEALLKTIANGPTSQR